MEVVTESEHPADEYCYRHPDRDTLVRCSSCERPICTSCMNETPVGLRCPSCAGTPTGVRRAVERSYRRGRVPITAAIMAVTCLAFVLQLGTSGQRGLNGGLTEAFELWGPFVSSDGEWWRILTVALVHGSIAHLAMNMISLWIVGSIVETGLGPVRYVGIYVAAVVWGSLGAMVLQPGAPVVGASGGIFGVFAAIMVVQLMRGGTVSSDIFGVLVLNLFITFAIPGISIGGHLGGIVGGALAAFAALGVDRQVRGPQRQKVAVAAMAAVVVVGAVACLWAAHRATDLITRGIA